MFKWPGTPTSQASEHELADFVELMCWQQGSTSVTATSKQLDRLDDNDYTQGVPEEEVSSGIVEDAYVEIERRKAACRKGYPFLVDDQGHIVRVNPHGDRRRQVIYKYLLLATRMDMNNRRKHADIDGTHLLEKLAAQSGREYFGKRAESIVFGTAADTPGFQDKVDDLCRQLGEGGGYWRGSQTTARQKDGKLDVVVWKPFADRRPGKLIGFGQCKTGTHYKDTLTELQPDSFCRKWLIRPPSVTPVRMFFVAEALPPNGWYNLTVDAGLLFDRCRIIDFCEEVDPEVLEKIETWTEAAARANNLPGK